MKGFEEAIHEKQYKDWSAPEKDQARSIGRINFQVSGPNARADWRDGSKMGFSGNCYYRIKPGLFLSGMGDEPETPTYNTPKPGLDDEKFIRFSGRATIVEYEDGEKIVVKCTKGDKFDPQKGFLLAHFLRTTGYTHTQMSKLMRELTEAAKDR